MKKISDALKTPVAIRRLRRTMKMTQKELAEQTGYNIRSIQAYEQGWRTPSDKIIRMMDLLARTGVTGAQKRKMRKDW